MKYRELLQLYKEGKLDDQTRKEVEETLDKGEAILDYLFDSSDIPGLDKGTEEDFTDALPDPSDEMEEKFKLALQRSIRKAFIKMGTTVGAILLACILLIEFVLPHVVDHFYYDPGEIAASDEEAGYQVNRMSMDLAVYTELFLPEGIRSNVSVSDNGYGSYDITITQNVAYPGQSFVDLNGRIDQNKLTLYDANAMKLPVDNVFEWSINQRDTTKSLTEQIPADRELSDGTTEMYHMSAGGSPKESLAALQELDEDTLYLAYVTLDQVLPYETVADYLERFDGSSAWCAVQTGEYIGGQNTGFTMSTNYSLPVWDNEKYPLLQTESWGGHTASDIEASLENTDINEEISSGTDEDTDINASASSGTDEGTDINGNASSGTAIADNSTNAEQKNSSVETATQHFISLLNYLDDQPRFRKMMGGALDYLNLDEMISYVKTNGLNIYGFALAADRETLLQLMDTEEVYSIYVTSL